MLNKSLEELLNLAIEDALKNGHQYVTIEHLLFVMLTHAEVVEILEKLGAKITTLSNNLELYLDELPAGFEQDADIELSLELKETFAKAEETVEQIHRNEVTVLDMLLTICVRPNCHAAKLLHLENVSIKNILQCIAEKNALDDHEESPLRLFATNLNERTMNGLIDPLIGRKNELEQIIQVLCCRRKNNPLLVGEPGVGKTAIVEGLAKLIIDKKVPELLQNKIIYSLDIGSLLAGTKYRGDFEDRIKKLLHHIKTQGNVILFIDEIHNIIGAGSSMENTLDISNLLKPMLTSGELICIGSTTYKEYRQFFQKEHALDRRFHKVEIPEPTIEESIEILKGLRKRFERFHHVKFTEEALKGAVCLSERFISERLLPDKAIDLIDEVGAYQFLLPEKKRKSIIELTDIEKMVAKNAHIPENRVTTTDRELLKHLEEDLEKEIFGQHEAIEALCAAIKMSRAGLREADKPIGSFLFAGPTGVGKTEVCKQLAKMLNLNLIRFDMSEYMESMNVSRLIGAPPGYVGYEEGGVLTEAVNKNPQSIVLFDEIEKAHPDIYQILLQVMDHGVLTDMNGRVVDFRHTLIIMTSNLGSEFLDKNSIGFTDNDNSSDVRLVVNKQFTPEFRNRLDAIIQFHSLNQRVILSVVDKFLHELESQLESKHVLLKVEKEAREWLASHGYDKAMGARPMAKIIQELIKKPLSNELLFGHLSQGGLVNVKVENDQIKCIVVDSLRTR